MGVSEGSDVGVSVAGAGGVGSLVWVRRRNGSWWPGRILGVDELPASPLMSPKSGTPVKLLGREDASVEWYNLEKSIRVKAFRCGEFDACIERAEASQTVPIKRREKYARREDAILHALELERKLHNPGDITNNISNKISSVMEEDCMGDPLYVHKVKNGKLLSREDDVPESMPRTRGLQDFGLRIAPPKKKHYQFVAWESLPKPVDNHADAVSSAGPSVGSARAGSFKRKSMHSGTPEESPAKRRDRRRPLVQVLENSAKLPSFPSFKPDHDEKEHMGAVFRAKRSRCIYLPADSNDSLDHVGYSFNHMPTAQARLDGSQRYSGLVAEENTSSGFEVIDSGSSERDCSENIVEEEDNLLRGSKNSGRYGRYSPIEPHMHRHGHDASVEMGASKWYMKGKRNIRNLPKSPSGGIIDNVSAEGISYESKGIDSSHRAVGHDFYPKKELGAGDEGDSKFIDSDDNSHVMSPPYVDQTYWKDPEFSTPIYDGRFGDEMEPMLVEVDLEVRARYQGEHVPLVSLMSRLNGKAIIGHPVQVEILEDGSSARVVSRSEPSLDESPGPSPVWKTARRTATQRVPRPNPAPSVPEGEGLEPLQALDRESKPTSKKAYTGHFSHQARLAKKSISHARRSASGKFQRKHLKSVSLSSGQKIRTLSSLSKEQKHGSENGVAKPSQVGCILPGLIKPEGTVPPVTCVPVKVAFSRILEAVGRPPSSAAHRGPVTGSTTKDPP